MATPEFKGPFLLTAEKVSIAVAASKAWPGTYMLGHTDDDGTFVVETIGRSDSNVKETLKAHAGQYQRFAFQYCATAKAAFERECDLYHELMAERGDPHPTRLEGSYWKCPHCTFLD